MENSNLQRLSADATSTYPEVKKLREDISSLKKDGIELAQHIAIDGRDKAAHLTETAAEVAKESYSQIKSSGMAQVDRLESYVRERPMQSIATAVVVGALLSMFLRRK